MTDINPDSKNEILTALIPDAVAALRAFVAWMDSDSKGPDYGTMSRDTHPDGEKIWKRWWDDQNHLCDRATREARAIVAKLEGVI